MSVSASAEQISMIIPVLNESENIVNTLERLQPLRQFGYEVIIVDGGSTDDTVALATPLADTVLLSPPGRARQMNEGAANATGDILWFLHGDTLVGAESHARLIDAIKDGACWGCFNVRLSGDLRSLRIIETMMNVRSCLTAVATGDQGIFVRAACFNKLGGYPDIPLMEDIALSKLLRQKGRPACIDEAIITSSRRWEKKGVLRTVLLMWWLRLLYWLGVSPRRLHTMYY
jgi:rSAM/selenodomain-associated transferase 2